MNQPLTYQELLLVKQKVQEEGRRRWNDAGRVGSLAYATGVGKSKVAIDAIDEIRHEYFTRHEYGIPQGLLVVPTEKMRDKGWPDEFTKWEVSMDGLKSVCYASLAKEDLSKYDYIIYDEIHKLTLPNLRKLEFIKGVNSNLIVLGLTATFPKVAKDDSVDTVERITLLQELVPPIDTITTDQAVDMGLISDFEIMVVKFYLDAVNKNIPSGTKKKEMRTEKEHYGKLTKSLSFLMYGSKNEGAKMNAIAKRMQFIYNLPSKQRLAKECLQNMSSARTLVFAGNIEQANALCGEQVYHSDSNDVMLTKFQNGEIDLLGCVRALNEGENLNYPDQSLIQQVDSQERNLVQRIGRNIRLRPHNPSFKAKIVILVAIGTVDEKWFKSSIAEFQTSRIKEFIVRVPDIPKTVSI